MTENPTSYELEQTKFDTFKASLRDFITGNYSVCAGFLTALDNCKCDNDINKLFVRYNDDVYEHIGGEPSLQDEVDELGKEVSNLEYEIQELENQLDDAKIFYSNSSDDDYKLEFIREYHQNYTPWELEDLLINGKKYLSQK